MCGTYGNLQAHSHINNITEIVYEIAILTNESLDIMSPISLKAIPALENEYCFILENLTDVKGLGLWIRNDFKEAIKIKIQDKKVYTPRQIQTHMTRYTGDAIRVSKGENNLHLYPWFCNACSLISCTCIYQSYSSLTGTLLWHQGIQLF